ncbi:MAG: hypothetical protein CMA41_01690 [Euryarchaeota archaeon]|jgi:hypothetical protein|nr:hypothetical protein [Euryarchaeota archaeon]|tara:strand:- start:1475 stop:2188 length:714 start_codon:yes stop_codon:yes gene_type:complete
MSIAYINRGDVLGQVMKADHQSTTPFYTLDGCHSGLVSNVFKALISSQQKADEEWTKMCEHPKIQDRFRTQGIHEWDSRDLISWDDPTILFTLTRMLDDDGLPIMLGEDRNRERFGRFPHQTGSTIQYVRDNVRDLSSQTSDLFEDLVTHLDFLLNRCNSDVVDDERYMDGRAGLSIMGFLTFEEVKTLRSTLLGGGWSVARDEPIDGGVRDAIRHLNALLLAAERRGAGIIHRKHA